LYVGDSGSDVKFTSWAAGTQLNESELEDGRQYATYLHAQGLLEKCGSYAPKAKPRFRGRSSNRIH